MSGDRVFIVGGGPSMVGFDFSMLANEDTIAINKALFDLPSANYFITMDYTFMTKSRLCGHAVDHKRMMTFSSNPAEKIFVVGFDDRRFKKNECTVVDTFTGLVYDLRLFNRVVWASGRGGIGLSFDDFRSSSDSGFSALQLAVILGYKEVYLLGLDFTVHKGRTHYHDWYRTNRNKYGDRLDWFFTEYGKAIQEINSKTSTRVFSCSSISRMNEIVRYVDVRSVL